MGNISYQDVTKEFNDGAIVAVDDLSLEVEDGEFLVLLGPSGCGKSTTLRMLAGLETVTEGEISIDGERVTGLEPRERNVAMVFQNYALYPHLTVEDNIAFSLRMNTDLDEDAIREQVVETAELLDIQDLLEKKPGALSGGQQQRVALGRAIIRDPSVFLFDEPLSNLDAKLRADMRTELTRLQQELGVTSVYVTHDQSEAMTMGDRIAVMNDGKLQQVGGPNDVYDHPANEFVAGFIGEPSMNFLDVRFDREDGPRLTTTGDGGSFVYPLSEAVADRLGVSDGARLTLGVRPEDIQVDVEATGASGRAQRTTVDVVEPMGSDSFVYFDVDGTVWTGRTDRIDRQPGSELVYEFDESALYLFDEDGETIKSIGTGEGSFHRETEEPLVQE
ncbi:sugar ABC transporter ATP-binding protein [Halobacteriales archaeon QS_4_69_31]|nr:MAG: sugar ABC transporter ATP-binding protein [Halobacteriales archaeon QS_4_69_31]